MATPSHTRKKVLGIGAPRFAHSEFEDLKQIADIFWFVPETHPQVVREVARLAKEHGPMDAAYVLFGTANYAPFMQDVLGASWVPLFAVAGLCAMKRKLELTALVLVSAMVSAGPLFPGCGLFASGGAGYDDVPTEWLAEQGACRPRFFLLFHPHPSCLQISHFLKSHHLSL